MLEKDIWMSLRHYDGMVVRQSGVDGSLCFWQDSKVCPCNESMNYCVKPTTSRVPWWDPFFLYRGYGNGSMVVMWMPLGCWGPLSVLCFSSMWHPYIGETSLKVPSIWWCTAYRQLTSSMVGPSQCLAGVWYWLLSFNDVGPCDLVGKVDIEETW